MGDNFLEADDEKMDDMFAAFMGEVNSIKSDKRKKIEEKMNEKIAVASPEELVIKLKDNKYHSAYDALGIMPEATEGEITKQYRKLSLMIHPDKCKVEGAHDAFEVLVKLYNDLKDPAYKEKYSSIIHDARERVLKARTKENELRKKKGEDPLDLEGKEFEQAVIAECDRDLTKSTEEMTYAEKTLQANLNREQGDGDTAKAAVMKERNDKKKWEKGRDKRVAGWQTFMHNVDTKKQKTSILTRVGNVGAANFHHKVEQRADWQQKTAEERKAAGTETDYKSQWR